MIKARMPKYKRMMVLIQHFYCVSMLLIAFWSSEYIVDGYPLLIKVPANEERCIRFTIPQNDDAHMIFLGLPGSNEGIDDPNDELEQFFVEQVYEISKRKDRNGDLPSKLPNYPPDNVSSKMEQFTRNVVDGAKSTSLAVQIGYKSLHAKKYDLMYFIPTVVSHALKTLPHMSKTAFDKMKNKRGGDDEYESLEGQWLCFDNTKNDMHAVTIVVDIVLVSEAAHLFNAFKASETSSEQRILEKDKHLTPLEEVLTESIAVAHKVLKEIKNNGKREDRMSSFGDRINTFIQSFSLISIAILISVTYIQITYLKKYFHKMKLM